MELLIVHSKGWIHWNIHKNDPVKYPIHILADWSFVNPLVHFAFDQAFKAAHNLLELYQTPIPTNRAIISTSHIMFVNHNNIFIENEGSGDEIRLLEDGDPFHEIIDGISQFLINLRHVSKQFQLPTGPNSFLSISREAISQLPKPNLPVEPPHSNVLLRKDIVDTAITWKTLEIAGNYPVNFSPPTFDTILLDAIYAFSDGDYRRAILYSAMAVEIIAATKLDEAYMSVIQHGDEKDKMRIISIPQAGGQTIVKDPVYEYLISKTDFGQLLHERPLYLFNRSLLIDNEQLYQSARKLYRTRNKIVHRGEPPSGEDTSHFGMNQADAEAAIDCAIGIFKWFGEGDEYIIPSSEFYEVSKLTSK